MMDLLAREIETTGSSTVLIALTKHARFVDKAKDVALSFPTVEKVIWLVGFDTLVRILDKKYYPSSLEESLNEFWERNRLVCAIRGEESVERGFVEKMRNGEVDAVPPLWADYVEIIEPVGREESSTRARNAAAAGRWEEVGIVVPEEIAAYIQRENLYA
jgi:nicotinamide-nucleotide adenylyltransferase